MAKNILKIQANIQGFSKDPGVTLFAVVSLDTGIVSIAKDVKFTTAAQEGFYVISAVRDGNRKEVLFTVEMMQEAIRAYINMEARGLLVIGDKLARYNPQAMIDHDGFDEKGPKYRLNPSIASGHIAVMAIAMAAKVQIEAMPAAEGDADMAEVCDFIDVGYELGNSAILKHADDSWI